MPNHTPSNSTAVPLSLHTPLVDILDCKYPILCAGMGGVARAELAAAVSEAGGFGCMGMVRESPQFIRQQIEQFRALSDRAFAVNIIPAATAAQVLRLQVDTLIDMKVPAVCLFWDVAPEVVRRFKQVGITVIHQVGSVVDAKKALQAGVDILIVQGVDAGGHVWATQSVFTLLPEICRMSPVPVVAAGGIATGQGIAAALVMGAQGVSCGSAFLATVESNAHNYHKQRLLEASADDTLYTTAFHINWPQGAAVRVLRNSVTEAGAPEKVSGAGRVQIAAQDGQPVFLYSTDSPLRGATGELERMALYAGRSCGDINDLCSAADRVRQLVEETVNSLRRSTRQESVTSGAQSHYELRSSPCMAGEFSGVYAGHCDDDELYDLFMELYEHGRAAAKVCAFSLLQAGVDDRHDTLLRVHFEVIRNCEALLQCLGDLDRETRRVSDKFFDECMAIEDFRERMGMLREDQERVVEKISAIMPRLGKPESFNQFHIMRDRNVGIIEYLDQLLKL